MRYTVDCLLQLFLDYSSYYNLWELVGNEYSPITLYYRYESTQNLIHCNPKAHAVRINWKTTFKLDHLIIRNSSLLPFCQTNQIHHIAYVSFALIIWSLYEVQRFYLNLFLIWNSNESKKWLNYPNLPKTNSRPGASSPPLWLIFETMINDKKWPNSLADLKKKTSLFFYQAKKKLLEYTGSFLQN